MLQWPYRPILTAKGSNKEMVGFKLEYIAQSLYWGHINLSYDTGIYLNASQTSHKTISNHTMV